MSVETINEVLLERKIENLNDIKKSKIDSDDSAIQSSDSADENMKSSENSASSSDVESSPQSSPTPESENNNLPSTKKNVLILDSSSKVVNECSELYFVQENVFTVKISPPGTKSFDVQVSPQEIVQELHHLLMDHDTTCHRTCFSLQLNGVKLDNFSELKSVPEIQNNCEIKVIEESYSLREVKAHLRHVRELLNSLDNENAFRGNEGHSLSYINLVTKGELTDENLLIIQESNNASSNGQTSPKTNGHEKLSLPIENNETDDKSTQTNGTKKHRNSPKSQVSFLRVPDSVDYKPPDYVMPGVKNPSLAHMHLKSDSNKVKPCIKVLTLSIWNPPPSKRKLQGDLMYIQVVTIENKRFEITASTRGFYINRSEMESFNPIPASYTNTFHSLVDLLMDISPAFKTNFPILNKTRCSRHLFERVSSPFQLHTWNSPERTHTVNHVHAEVALSNRMAIDENIPGQFSRDWNEEMSATRELPKKTMTERLLRERAMFKVHSDFVSAATRGAMMVVEGNVMAINPGDDKNNQMFIWNNIFFSLGFDVRDHYKDLGGDYAAFYAPVADLGGLRAYQAVDIEGLHTLGTIVVDYRGYRVTAQSIIPGILEREQEQSIVYGSIDFGKTVLTNDKYEELLDKIAKPLRQLKHSVVNQTSEEKNAVEMRSSVECKGIIGNDSRYYILDLLRTFPPDVNFLPIDDPLEVCRSNGFPRKHRHSLATLRPELVEAFAEFKYMSFMQSCATQILTLKSLNMKKTDGLAKILTGTAVPEQSENKKNEIENNNTKENGDKSCENNNNSTTAESWQQDVVKKSAVKFGSCCPDEFDLRFNSDVYADGVLSAESSEVVESQKSLVKEACAYLVTNTIPSYIQDCEDHSSSVPCDGQSLTDSLHDRGINIRYLGFIAKLATKRPNAPHLKRICVSEIIARSIKHIFRTYLQSVDQLSVSSAIAHFLNCLLSAFKTPTPSVTDLQNLINRPHSNSRRKKKNKKQKESSEVRMQWNKLSPTLVWQQITTEAKEYYDFDLDVTSIEDVNDKYNIQKMALLRSTCLRNGIQIMCRDYDFDCKQRSCFTDDDIIDVYPCAKHVPPRASDAYHFFATGQMKLQQGCLKEGMELLNEALGLFNNVYGVMHSEIGTSFRNIARINYITGEYLEAVSNQQKAAMMFERVFGVDHITTISSYSTLAIYCFSNSQIVAALRLLYRSRYLLMVAYGDDHPEMAQINCNIGLILHALQNYDLSLQFLNEALRVYLLQGKANLKTALSYHLVARAFSCKGNFREALNREKEAFKLYQQLLGDRHEKTKESAEFLRHLTQQAVNLQRTMNEIYKKGSTATIPPLQIMPPSVNSVLDLINAMNGIISISKEVQQLAKKEKANPSST